MLSLLDIAVVAVLYVVAIVMQYYIVRDYTLYVVNEEPKVCEKMRFTPADAWNTIDSIVVAPVAEEFGFRLAPLMFTAMLGFSQYAIYVYVFFQVAFWLDHTYSEVSDVVRDIYYAITTFILAYLFLMLYPYNALTALLTVIVIHASINTSATAFALWSYHVCTEEVKKTIII